MENQNYMPNKQPKKALFRIIFFGALISLAVLVIFLFLFFRTKEERPYEVLTPIVYSEGTTISLYKNAPAGFPNDLILEDVALDYSGTVQNPDGSKQITVSYISEQDMPTITEAYSARLENSGWKIINSSKLEKVSILQATKSPANLTVTIAPIKSAKTMVTFQYENN